MSKYQEFLDSLNSCLDKANEYLNRCLISGQVDPSHMRYFKNLTGLTINENGDAILLCSNTNPHDSHEAINSYNIKFINIDQELFNKDENEFNSEHLDMAIHSMIPKLNDEQKKAVYDIINRMNIK